MNETRKIIESRRVTSDGTWMAKQPRDKLQVSTTMSQKGMKKKYNKYAKGGTGS